MMATHKRCISALILCSILISIVDAQRITENMIDIYKNAFAGSYKPEDLFKKYAARNQCSGVDYAIHKKCLKERASERGLVAKINYQSQLNQVCCFFWESIECAKELKCNIMWEAVYSTFIRDQLAGECSHVESKDDVLCKVYPNKKKLQE